MIFCLNYHFINLIIIPGALHVKSDIFDSQWHLGPIKDKLFWLKTDIFIVGSM